MRHRTNDAIGLALMALAAGALAGCRQEVRFTKVPPAAHVEMASRAEPASFAEPASVYVGVPVQLARLRAQVDRAIPQTMKKLVDWLDDVACFKRRGVQQCVGARADLVLHRDGAVKLRAEGDRLQIEVPLRYDLRARGLRGARGIRDSSSGKLKAVVDLKVNLKAHLKPVATLSDKVQWSKADIAILKGKFDVARNASGKIRRLLHDGVLAFQEDLSKAPIAASALRVWKLLHRPLKLQSGPDVWLSSQPLQISDGGFLMERGRLLYRIAIAARLRIVRGQAPDPIVYRPMPGTPAAAQAIPLRSIVRVPLAIGYGAAKEALRRAWPEVINVKATRSDNRMRINVRDSELYPSGQLVALGLNLDVATPGRAFDLTGKAYLTAQPVLNVKTGTFVMRQIKLAEAIVIPGVGAGTGQRFRLPAAPFVKGFSKVLRIDASRGLSDLLAKANLWFNQSLDDGLRLSGHFDALSAARVEPMSDGFRAELDLRGALLITAPAGQQQGAAETQALNGAVAVPTKTE